MYLWSRERNQRQSRLTFIPGGVAIIQTPQHHFYPNVKQVVNRSRHGGWARGSRSYSKTKLKSMSDFWKNVNLWPFFFTEVKLRQ